MLLKLPTVRTDGGTQPRAQLDFFVIDDYAASMASGAVFPAIEVVYDGTDYWLVDGFHRVEAARQAGIEAIEANVTQGTLYYAQWQSYGVNATHGLRRTNEDKRRAVEAALKHEMSATLTDVQIAKHCGVSSMTVGSYRKTIIKSFNDTDTVRTVTRNGATYTMNTAGIGRAATGVVFEPEFCTRDEAQKTIEERQNTPGYNGLKFYRDEQEEISRPHVSFNSGENEWYKVRVDKSFALDRSVKKPATAAQPLGW